MASLLKNTNFLSQLRSQSQMKKGGGAFAVSSRGLHVEPGLREKALLASDPALSRFKSHKKSVKRIKRIGDVLTVVVVAGCCYEIYVRATMREEARSAAGESSN